MNCCDRLFKSMNPRKHPGKSAYNPDKVLTSDRSKSHILDYTQQEIVGEGEGNTLSLAIQPNGALQNSTLRQPTLSQSPFHKPENSTRLAETTRSSPIKDSSAKDFTTSYMPSG